MPPYLRGKSKYHQGMMIWNGTAKCNMQNSQITHITQITQMKKS